MAEHQTRTSSQSPMLTGMFRDRDSAEKAYTCITNRGYTKDDVTLLMSDEARKRHFSHQQDTELGTKAAEGAGIGGSRRALQSTRAGRERRPHGPIRYAEGQRAAVGVARRGRK